MSEYKAVGYFDVNGNQMVVVKDGKSAITMSVSELRRMNRDSQEKKANQKNKSAA